MLNPDMVDRIVAFKGGVMDRAKITYQMGSYPEDEEEMFIDRYGISDEVYIFSSDLSSWIYDHESEVIEE